MSKESWVTSPRVVEKPWGREEIFAEVDGKYVGKRLFVKAGESLSLQYHEVKDETQFALDGTAQYEVGDHEDSMDTFEVSAGESLHFPAGRRHRITAITDYTFVEASTTELLDVVRLEDRYGRQGTSAP